MHAHVYTHIPVPKEAEPGAESSLSDREPQAGTFSGTHCSPAHRGGVGMEQWTLTKSDLLHLTAEVGPRA